MNPLRIWNTYNRQPLIERAAEVERIAIEMYERDGMMLAIYKTGAESWPHDREAVKERYRTKARQSLN